MNELARERNLKAWFLAIYSQNSRIFAVENEIR